MMLQVSRIDISKGKNVLASISKSNLFALVKGKKNDLRGNSTEKKISLKIYGESDNLMNFEPVGGRFSYEWCKF